MQLVVHRGDQLVRLDPHAAQRVSQLAEDVLFEQIPLTLTEQLAVPRDRRGQPTVQLHDGPVPRVVPADRHQYAVLLDESRFVVRGRAVLQVMLPW